MMLTQTTQNDTKAVGKKEPLAGQPGRDTPLPFLPIFQQMRPMAQAGQNNTLAKTSLQRIVSHLNYYGPTLQRELGDQTAQVATDNFKKRYEDFVGKLPKLHLDISGRIAEFVETFGEQTIEDYSDVIFDHVQITILLKSINETLEKGQIEDEAIKGRIADMLLLTSLTPSYKEEKKQKFGRSRFTRQTFEGLSPTRLVEILIQTHQQISSGAKSEEADSLKGITFGDKDSLAQRLLKLSLANALPKAREAMQGDALFQKILNSPHLVEVVMASSGGAIEQQFLNTCVSASLSQMVQTQVTTIAGLLHVGRAMCDFIMAQIADPKNQENLAQEAKKKVSLKDYATNRVNNARGTFTDIEKQATELVQTEPVDTNSLHELTRSWGREMQKLSAIADLSVKVEEIPVLSQKIFNEQWGLSAVALAFGKGADRTGRRWRGVDPEAMLGGLNQTLNVAKKEDMENLNDNLGDDVEARKGKMAELWQKLFDMGGAPFNQVGHSLFMRALVQGNERVFAVGDPKINHYEFRTAEEMELYIRTSPEGVFSVPKTLANPHPAGYFVRDGVKLYVMVQSIGQDDKVAGTANRDTAVQKVEEKKFKDKNYYRVTTKDASGFVQEGDFVRL